MSEPPRAIPSGTGLSTIIYVITCGMCGNNWQRATAQDGQVIGCIFCGSQGHLRLGIAPPDGGARDHCQVEAWLHAGGPQER
jgi:hypothetical protein